MPHRRGQDHYRVTSSWFAIPPGKSKSASGAPQAPPAPHLGRSPEKSHTHVALSWLPAGTLAPAPAGTIIAVAALTLWHRLRRRAPLPASGLRGSAGEIRV